MTTIGDCIICGSRCMSGSDKCYSCLQAERKAEKNEKKFKTATKVKVVTEKRAGELRLFEKQKKEYLEAFMCCEVPDCHDKSVDVHHRGTRTNHNLNDLGNFIALCRFHHTYYTEHSNEAKELGISKVRTTNHTKI